MNAIGRRLAPEQRFPAALDDAFAVLTWAAELGIDPGQIVTRLTKTGER